MHAILMSQSHTFLHTLQNVYSCLDWKLLFQTSKSAEPESNASEAIQESNTLSVGGFISLYKMQSYGSLAIVSIHAKNQHHYFSYNYMYYCSWLRSLLNKSWSTKIKVTPRCQIFL